MLRYSHAIKHWKGNDFNKTLQARIYGGGGGVQRVQTPALSRYSPNCALKFLNQFTRNALKNQFKKRKNPLKHLKNTVKGFF